MSFANVVSANSATGMVDIPVGMSKERPFLRLSLFGYDMLQNYLGKIDTFAEALKSFAESAVTAIPQRFFPEDQQVVFVEYFVDHYTDIPEEKLVTAIRKQVRVLNEHFEFGEEAALGLIAVYVETLIGGIEQFRLCTLEQFKNEAPRFIDSLLTSAQVMEASKKQAEGTSLLEAAVMFEAFCSTAHTVEEVRKFMTDTSFTDFDGEKQVLGWCWFPGLYPALFEPIMPMTYVR